MIEFEDFITGNFILTKNKNDKVKTVLIKELWYCCNKTTKKLIKLYNYMKEDCQLEKKGPFFTGIKLINTEYQQCKEYMDKTFVLTNDIHDKLLIDDIIMLKNNNDKYVNLKYSNLYDYIVKKFMTEDNYIINIKVLTKEEKEFKEWLNLKKEYKNRILQEEKKIKLKEFIIEKNEYIKYVEELKRVKNEKLILEEEERRQLEERRILRNEYEKKINMLKNMYVDEIEL